ncbi:hypothetical protein EIB18_04665 [Caulobacter vibrioides]|uniref:hypothetical protein n=1 Tax=Caulobacter vibrioides TaxID=155892 RepID=UPI000BB51D88|nr:hypothetical protein [Caulobacter vibrioides]ATC23837.1 hypothetical protein CA608_04455 [Caulobacter vibrioides]AZH12073.1 hypothetical protein EIB18_04665 [Caulobacter vibrioides]PLR15954.1 hypothetical protein CVUC_02350 [Caulobacter vibrioides]
MAFKFRAAALGALMLVAAGAAQAAVTPAPVGQPLAQFDKLKPASPAPDGSVWVKMLLW